MRALLLICSEFSYARVRACVCLFLASFIANKSKSRVWALVMNAVAAEGRQEECVCVCLTG